MRWDDGFYEAVNNPARSGSGLARYSLGVSPVTRLNSMLKADLDANPASKAICRI